ncbi:MAG: hypothetical protein D8M57_08920 [Candidatus Scalindua sp. AMX11]|nr:MAG: hypothetical protein DWQ00_10120 [Candidatus Scalindua sp.]NOG84519.1 hypothetical protein [Planctomycetota bacterium]RZV80473.1 MAG: hypothetical protein EX341_10505 [Candidatus Scalindua sp. SCAELEC01]TDE65306.1 MAG: hypothetical protein D8M57_08920 [Candidatus Scalindua sp. AMX11]GJQ58520.1 MAG: hypothetical protein SCALA701_13210 [Candidatus Scalindua sp.]
MNTNKTIPQEELSTHKPGESEALRALNHRLCNIQGIIESCNCLLKKEDAKSMIRRWSTVREILKATGRDRIHREMIIYCTKREVIEGISRKKYRYVYDKITIADSYYKSLFDLIHNSIPYSDEGKNASVIAGEKITKVLVHIVKKLEDVKVELQKAETLDR